MNKFNSSTGYVQKNNPFDVTSCGRRRSFMQSPLKKADPARTIGKGKNFNKANPTGTGAMTNMKEVNASSMAFTGMPDMSNPDFNIGNFSEPEFSSPSRI